jgi:hypothetical protein
VCFNFNIKGGKSTETTGPLMRCVLGTGARSWAVDGSCRPYGAVVAHSTSSSTSTHSSNGMIVTLGSWGPELPLGPLLSNVSSFPLVSWKQVQVELSRAESE